jgi:hypothetical protein
MGQYITQYYLGRIAAFIAHKFINGMADLYAAVDLSNQSRQFSTRKNNNWRVRILIIFVLNCMLLCVIRLPFKNLNC